MSGLSGMTGFGRSEGAHGAWTWAVEARSVNGRNLEVRFRGPPGFDSLERTAREAAQARFQRGQLTIGVQAKRQEAVGGVRINVEMLERYLSASSAYVATGLAAAPRMDGLLALRGVIEHDAGEDAEGAGEAEAAMALCIGQAVAALEAARREEGAQLAPVMSGLVDRIEALTIQAGDLAADQPAAIKARFGIGRAHV